MKQVQKLIPGILGGMGPLAHTAFEEILLKQSCGRGACCDQEHPVWILVNAADIPDRTDSLFGKTVSCVPRLIKYGQLLASAGADFLVVPCNTVHAFYRFVQPELQLPWIHLIECTIEYITCKYPKIQKIGILCTDGTLYASLYQDALLNAGLLPVFLPLDSALQNKLMQVIYDSTWGLKVTGSEVSQRARNELKAIADYLTLQGAELLISGCSELSVGFKAIEGALTFSWVDPLRILADITLDLVYGHRTFPK